MLIIFIPGVLAGPVVYGYVHITIDNKAPKLTDLTFSKDQITQKTDCNAKILDEFPSEGIIRKKWIQNGFIVKKPNFSAGNDITCILTPVDKYGKSGADYELNLKIAKPKTALDIIKIQMLKS